MKATPRVYLPEAKSCDRIALTPSQSHHLLHVLRLANGAPLLTFDGEGYEFHARLERDRNRAVVLIGEVSRLEAEPALAITLIACIARAQRMEWTLEKAVELGVAAIQPVYSERGKLRADAVHDGRRLEHWQAVVASAASQCGRAWLPPLAEPIPLTAVLNETVAESRIVLMPEAPQSLASLSAPGRDLALLVGPESGFSRREKESLAAAGWQAARLGPRILRTETAGPAALAAIQTLWGDWR